MEWANDPKYIIHRKNVIQKLENRFTNGTTIRRLERQIYNIATNESRVSSWGNGDYISNYFNITEKFLEIVKTANIAPETFDDKIITTKTITQLLGYDNYRYILTDILGEYLNYGRKNIIFTLYEKMMRIPKFKKLNNEKKLEIAVTIEKSCNNELERIIAKRGYDKYHHNREIADTYNYIACRTITYLDIDSPNKALSIIKNITDPSIYSKLGAMVSEDIFKDKFQTIIDEIDIRQNIHVNEKISTEHTCKVCKASKVTIKGIQTRSLDEGETLYAECVECRNKWRLS